jgi:hypothetical protein
MGILLPEFPEFFDILLVAGTVVARCFKDHRQVSELLGVDHVVEAFFTDLSVPDVLVVVFLASFCVFRVVEVENLYAIKSYIFPDLLDEVSEAFFVY